MQPQQIAPGRKKLIIGGTVAGGLLLVALILSFSGAGKITLTLRVSPMDSQLTVDGKITPIGKITVSKGKHTFVATRKHFDPETLHYDTKNASGKNEVYVILDANDQDGRDYIAGNTNEQMLREAASGNQFSATQESILTLFPFVTDMPYNNIDYNIDYQTLGNYKIKLLVSINLPNSTAQGTPLYDQEVARIKADAQAYMRSKNIDYNKIQTEYSIDNATPEERANEN